MHMDMDNDHERCLQQCTRCYEGRRCRALCRLPRLKHKRHDNRLEIVAFSLCQHLHCVSVPGESRVTKCSHRNAWNICGCGVARFDLSLKVGEDWRCPCVLSV